MQEQSHRGFISRGNNKMYFLLLIPINGLIANVHPVKAVRSSSKDYFIGNEPKSKQQELLAYYTEQDSYMPAMCRRNYCKDHTERDRVTGIVTWGAIPVGQIRVGVCPHVNVHNRTSPVLITRQCFFDGEALWGNSTKLESCPATERMQILVDLPDEIKDTPQSWKEVIKKTGELLSKPNPHKDSLLTDEATSLTYMLTTFLDKKNTVKCEDLKDLGETIFRITSMVEGRWLSRSTFAALSERALVAARSVCELKSACERSAAFSYGSFGTHCVQQNIQSRSMQLAANGRKFTVVFAPNTIEYEIASANDTSNSETVFLMDFRNKALFNNVIGYIDDVLPATVSFIKVNISHGIYWTVAWESLLKQEPFEDQITCVRLPEDSQLDANSSLHWQSSDCSGHYSSDTNIAFCQCNVTRPSFFAIFSKRKPDYVWKKGSTVISDESSLLRFAYVWELHIVSHILRGISLACLIFTVSTFLIFRKLRKGSPSRILINLCVALILLLATLYIGEAISAREAGCIIANASRIYAILLSLMWNGAEGLNMYLLLVKVFTNNYNYVRRAAAVAYGVPILLIVTPFAIDRQFFNGEWIGCTFKCQLPRNTMYFLFLFPMITIIVFNLTIFTCVLRILSKSSKNQPSGGRRFYWTRVRGAVTMLVLLGIPWIFSIFGAIDDHQEKELSIIKTFFQIVFVLFVNMQGIFICTFHCVRIPEVRSSWSSLLSNTVCFMRSSKQTSTGQRLFPTTSTSKQHSSSTTKETTASSTGSSREKAVDSAN